VAETGQPYAYTGDDPVNARDPKGLWYTTAPDLVMPRYTYQQAEANEAVFAQIWLQATSIRFQPLVYTSTFHRRPDFTWVEPGNRLGITLDEVKAGTGGTLNSTTRRQAAADVAIRNAREVGQVDWDFYPGRTGYTGPSRGLRKLLETDNINIRVHVYDDDGGSPKPQPTPPPSFPGPVPVPIWDPIPIPVRIPAPIPVP
jgi:hypothetical protein